MTRRIERRTILDFKLNYNLDINATFPATAFRDARWWGSTNELRDRNSVVYIARRSKVSFLTWPGVAVFISCVFTPPYLRHATPPTLNDFRICWGQRFARLRFSMACFDSFVVAHDPVIGRLARPSRTSWTRASRHVFWHVRFGYVHEWFTFRFVSFNYLRGALMRTHYMKGGEFHFVKTTKKDAKKNLSTTV